MMSKRMSRGIAAAIVGCAMATSGCIATNSAAGDLIDLTASTSGSLIEILVRTFLTGKQADADPDPSTPLSEQQH